MVLLKDYIELWNDVAAGVPQLTGVLPVTVDDDMGRSIQALPKGSVTLFVLPPVADSKLSEPDAFAENNECVVFLMSRYDPQRVASIEALAEVQPVMEDLKARLLDTASGWCCGARLDLRSLTTMPETKFYAGFAGWSLGFTLIH